ncbi:MAG: DNA repair protein RecO [candidate division Zixibacteria bacterium]|nr:DNA repair protein RecO [candidate division Zixibacteria bacterium]
MQWEDDGIVLTVRRHGETSALVTLLSRSHGRHAGLVRGGTSRRLRGILQPGNKIHAVWRARLPEHLGTLACEPIDSVAAALFGHPRRLRALSAACAVTEAALPEREPHPEIHDALANLLKAMGDDEGWPAIYVKWEVDLLRYLGFGLDLAVCAATGERGHLTYVSPRSGRAVSAVAGEPYRAKLLPLPSFLLTGEREVGSDVVAEGLRLTGYFLERHVFAHRGYRLPAARRRLADLFAKDME